MPVTSDRPVASVVRHGPSRSTWRCKVNDLSVGGFSVLVTGLRPKHLVPGNQVDADLTFPDAPAVSLPCKVRHVTRQEGTLWPTWIVGLEFMDCPALTTAAVTIVGYEARSHSKAA